MKNTIPYFLLLLILACSQKHPVEKEVKSEETHKENVSNTSLVLLGTIQDAGSPHIACKTACCKDLFENPDSKRQVIALGLFDKETSKKYLFEATPDMTKQMKSLKEFAMPSDKEIADGIFLTHAHIGHYTGLMYLGKEATDTKQVPVYAMPRMKSFLENNGPWSQLISRENIVIHEIQHEKSLSLSSKLKVTPFLVPHRDEFSETVGYLIEGPSKSALFIPDIDKWGKWDKNIVEEIKKVDYAFLDATFYSGVELNNRDISQIPHPFVIESLDLFEELNEVDRKKVIFIHFNHSNPIIDLDSKEAKHVIEEGFRIGQLNQQFEL